MLLMRLWNYLRGYVIIVVEGYFLEKFINICTHRQIYLWDVRVSKNCSMTLKVSIKGFKRMRPVARKTKCRVRIKCRVGVPFIINRYRKRKALFIGALIFIGMVYTLTSFIWTVEVTGNMNIPTEVILSKLAECGVKPGRLKYGLNIDRIVSDIVISTDEIGWMGLSLSGTKAKVEIVERVKPPEIIDRDTPCDIIAEKDGVIKTLIVENGSPAVKVGDTVKQGQLLVSGTIKGKYEGQQPRMVHSMATVTARTWYEINREVKQEVTKRVRTGKKKSSIAFIVVGSRFEPPFMKARVSGAFEKEEKVYGISLGKSSEILFGIVRDTYHEIRDEQVRLTPEEAKKNTADEALKILTGQIPLDAKIETRNVNFIDKNDGTIVANVIIECIEDIGMEQKIK